MEEQAVGAIQSGDLEVAGLYILAAACLVAFLLVVNSWKDW